MYMRINYFDLGLYRGVELDWMIRHIFPSLGIKAYKAYGFEASKLYADRIKNRYESNSKVEIFHKAIADSEKTIKMFHSYRVCLI